MFVENPEPQRDLLKLYSASVEAFIRFTRASSQFGVGIPKEVGMDIWQRYAEQTSPIWRRHLLISLLKGQRRGHSRFWEMGSTWGFFTQIKGDDLKLGSRFHLNSRVSNPTHTAYITSETVIGKDNLPQYGLLDTVSASVDNGEWMVSLRAYRGRLVGCSRGTSLANQK